DDLYDDANLPDCPACYSEQVSRISDADKTHALGLYDIYDFIGQINIMTNNFRCQNCGYEW
ncbi:MAG: hypothetical protein PHP53_24380, partial [Prolixibacteraceae bacterium]|nr:hypothetical protein [Prolixibacteraceae bacterium]